MASLVVYGLRSLRKKRRIEVSCLIARRKFGRRNAKFLSKSVMIEFVNGI